MAQATAAEHRGNMKRVGPLLTSRARAMRKTKSPAEARLWTRLCDGQLRARFTR